MNISTPIRMEVKNFRAIKKADIIIDGITVITGENSCGKSTLSKLLYLYCKSVIDYHYPVSLSEELMETYSTLSHMLREEPKSSLRIYKDTPFKPSKKESLQPIGINKVIHLNTLIDTKQQNAYWDELLKTKEEFLLSRETQDCNLSDLISNEIIWGEASFKADNLSSKYIFKIKDGKTFDLMECSAGIKAFSTLQLLLKNGSLTDKTLLIIDSPESHLHPKWVVDYARILVLLNKQLGVKIFLSSYHPDMVGAIRYISEKENTLNTINFYLAEKSKEIDLYNYNHTKQDIETIFESFNKAIDLVNKYGI